MTLVMTLLARDEADIVDAQIAFHLNAGVDFVIATDNRSEDRTLAIFERYARSGHLHLIRENANDRNQPLWVTRMARLAATDFEADWVINSDADEFWWPRGGTLKDVLALVPERYGVVRGAWRHYLPRSDDGAFFAERMTVRLCAAAHPGRKDSIYHAHQKVAHRASRDVMIERGNHNAEGTGLEPLRTWFPIEVLHFSIRSLEQLTRKAQGAHARIAVGDAPAHAFALDEALGRQRLREYFESILVGDDDLERGLANGTLAVDTRLRDALRAVRGDDGAFVLPDAARGGHLTFVRPDVREDAAFAGEVSALAGIDGVVRADQRVAALETRLWALERGPGRRLAVRGQALARRLRGAAYTRRR
jgi:hypothetical protein